MHRLNQGETRHRRRGFTLWELALALGVLAMLVGMTWPVVTRFVGENRLKEDTSALRGQLASTRSRAIRRGVTFQFRFEPGGRQYIVLPFERPVAVAAPSVSHDDAPSVVTDVEFQVQAFQLAEGNLFETNDPQVGTALSSAVFTEQLTEDWLQMFGGSSELARINWSPPILFDADGTADDAWFYVQDEDGRYQQISVRGLTAVVSIGDLQRERRM